MDLSTSLMRHLEEDYTEPIRDPLWRNIYVSPGLIKTIDSPVFQKLKKIKQLGPTYHVYPGATHTRFIHSLGVFHTAKKMLSKLLPRMRTKLTLTEVKSFLAACLLHDIGHFPYAHSLKGLNLKPHETLTAELIVSTELSVILEKEAGADPRLTAEIVDVRGASGKASPSVILFKNLLSGALDPDKLDYLCRDAYYCGVPYGVQDIEYVFDKLTVYNDTIPAIQASGVTAVEHILFSKYLMYKTVYWHKAVRIATAMVKKVVCEALRAGSLVPGDLYLKDDEEFAAMVKTKNIAGSGIIEELENRKYYKLVLEIPFNPQNVTHEKLEDHRARSAMERDLASMIPGDGGDFSVIVDVPEEVTFEAGIPLVDGENGAARSFLEGTTVFSKDFAVRLSRSLRFLRVLVRPELQSIAPKEAFKGYLGL